METIAAGALLGPHEFASAPGLEKRLARGPQMVCFVDELGDELHKVPSQHGNPFVEAIFGLLKKCYNAFTTVITAEKANEEGGCSANR